MTEKIARRPHVVQTLDEARPRSFAIARHDTGDAECGRPVVLGGAEQIGDAGFAFPFSTQSMAPSACSRISAAVNETLCPPTNTKISGHRRLVSLARSTISGMLAR